MSPALYAELASREALDQRTAHDPWPHDPDAPSDMLDTPEIHEDETVRRLVLARHAPLVAKLHPWERASGFHLRDDGHVTVAEVFRARRQFMDAGWDTRLIAEADEPFVLWLEVRLMAGCAAPYLGAPLRIDDGALARYREHMHEAGEAVDDGTTDAR